MEQAGPTAATRLFDLGEALDARGDHSRAADAYSRAIEEQADHAPSLYNLACCFDQGVGRPRDPAEALSLFERAGDAGDADGAYNAALAHEEMGHPVGVVLSWYARAAAKQHPEALNNLALLEEDKGESARVALFKAALSGLPEAQYNYAVMCEEEGDYDSAAHWWAEAAARGNRSAMYNLGVMHSWGHGVPASMEAASECFEMAATAREKVSTSNSTKDEDETLRTEALFRVGLAHLYSLGRPRSLKRAGAMFYDCASRGHAPSARELEIMMKTYRAAMPLPCSNPDCTKLDKPSTRLKLCPGCGGAAYCGSVCQKRHWAQHRRTCRQIKLARASETGKLSQRLQKGTSKELSQSYDTMPGLSVE